MGNYILVNGLPLGNKRADIVHFFLKLEYIMSAKIFTLYLSTQTVAGSIYAPVDTNNFSSITWNINWDMLYGGMEFNGAERIARAKFELRSLSQSAVLTDANNTGVLAIRGLSNQYSNSQNGLVLGMITPANEPVGGGTNHILIGNSLETTGVQCNLPFGYQPLSVLLLNRTGALMSGTTNYQVVIQFEME